MRALVLGLLALLLVTPTPVQASAIAQGPASATAGGYVSAVAQTFPSAAKTFPVLLSSAFTVGASGTSLVSVRIWTIAIDPPSVPAHSSASGTYTVSGLTTTAVIACYNSPSGSIGTGMGPAGYRPTATDTLGVRWINVTGSAINPTSFNVPIVAID